MPHLIRRDRCCYPGNSRVCCTTDVGSNRLCKGTRECRKVSLALCLAVRTSHIPLIMEEYKLFRQLHHLVCMTFHILQYSTEVRRASQDMIVGYKSSPFRACSQDYYRTCLGTICLLLVPPLNKQRIESSDLPFQRRTVRLILHFRLEGASTMLLLPDPPTRLTRLVL